MRLLRRAANFSVGVVVTFGLAGPADAAPIACVDGASLQSYIALGSTGCVVGNLVFYDFNYSVVTAEDADPVDAADVIVQTILGPDIGLLFEGEWYSTFLGNLVQQLDYTVATLDSAPLIKDNTLTGDLYAGIAVDAFASVIEQKCLGAAFTGPFYSCSGFDAALFINTLVPIDTNHLDFSPVSIVGVHNLITAFGGTGQAEVDSFANTFSQVAVPEPGLVTLMALGAAAVMRRRITRV